MKPIYQSTHNVMLKAFLLMFVCTVFHFVVPMELSAQQPSQFGDMFKDSSSVSSQTEQKFDEAVSGLLWWVKKAALIFIIIAAVVGAIFYLIGQKPITELVKPAIGALFIGGLLQIGITIFFEVASKAAN